MDATDVEARDTVDDEEDDVDDDEGMVLLAKRYKTEPLRKKSPKGKCLELTESVAVRSNASDFTEEDRANEDEDYSWGPCMIEPMTEIDEGEPFKKRRKVAGDDHSEEEEVEYDEDDDDECEEEPEEEANEGKGAMVRTIGVKRKANSIRKSDGEKSYIYSCQMCDFKTDRFTNLANHKMSHSGQKPFACSMCDYRTAYATNLIAHSRTHAERETNELGNKIDSCRHYLEEVTSGQRRRCVACYRNLSAENGRQFAMSKTPHSRYKCVQCEKFYCVTCFTDVHVCTM